VKIFACGGGLSRRAAFKWTSNALLQAANQRALLEAEYRQGSDGLPGYDLVRIMW
jgi:hypothetical protein